MATEFQINANRQNAALSTGPRSEAGRAVSSRNALTFGLYTRQDYVTFEEQDIYRQFCETMYSELEPVSLLEQALTAEITGASWRLRRCSEAEYELGSSLTIDPLLDPQSEKFLRSIERARTAAHGVLNRSINQLRKLQTERASRPSVELPAEAAASPAPVSASPAFPTVEEIRAFCEPPEEVIRAIDDQLEAIRKRQEGNVAAFVASAKTPRNAKCPCGSGRKYKVCCLRKGSGWGGSGVRKAA
jgi:hypothetical protein